MKYFYTWLVLLLCCTTVAADELVTNKFLLNPSFENGTTNWTLVQMVTQTNTQFAKTGNVYLEKWVDKGKAVGNGSATQVVNFLPAGNYQLTATAQNVDQNDLSAAQTGAVIFAGTKTTTVTSSNTYSVEFTMPTTSSSISIGFKAANASGNWICVDNFKLYYLNTKLASLQAAATLAQTTITNAEKAVRADIRPDLKTALQEAINLVGTYTEETDAEILKTTAFDLAAKHKAASENADELYALKITCNKSKTLLTRDMAAKYNEDLQALYDEALLLLAFEKEGSPTEMNTRLTAAFDAANESYNAKRNLKTKITQAKNLQDDEKEGNEAFLAAIEEAEATRDRADATPEDMIAATAAIESAMLQYRIDNGSGETPKVTTVTSFFIPAAHGALIRASYSANGTTIKEHGICWSKDREPDVTDNRSTDFYDLHGNLYHIKNMEPASVYYVRAYAMTTKYRVGYGEVMKIVTLPQGSCVGTWNNGAPDEAANERCRTAIQQTMDYLNEWTAIQGFHLTGNYGAQTPTADCSYGGWMRIGPNPGNQAIGTVIHETGHGVGVGTHWRWNNCTDTRENQGKYGKWLGSWANKTLQFLENNYGEGTFFTGDAVHGWGNNATFDWLVNGADKDKHLPEQYIGGCALLYGLYVDGLCPTTGYSNGVPGYTFNFDDSKKYYIKCEDPTRGLYDGFLYQRTSTSVAWKVAYRNDLEDTDAWHIEYDAKSGLYRFKNVGSGKYLTHTTAMTLVSTSSPTYNQSFQLMPGRKDLVINEGSTTFTAPSFWFTWNNSGDKAMTLSTLNKSTNYGTASITNFNFSDAGGTTQRYIIISEDELEAYETAALPTGIHSTTAENEPDAAASTAVYSIDGRLIKTIPAGTRSLNDLRLPRGIYMIGGKKVVIP